MRDTGRVKMTYKEVQDLIVYYRQVLTLYEGVKANTDTIKGKISLLNYYIGRE